MNWFSKFIKFINSPSKVDEVEKDAVIKKAVKEATVTLSSLDKAIIDGKVISDLKKPRRARTKKDAYIQDNKATKGKAPKKKVSKPTPKTVRIKKKK